MTENITNDNTGTTKELSEQDLKRKLYQKIYQKNKKSTPEQTEKRREYQRAYFQKNKERIKKQRRGYALYLDIYEPEKAVERKERINKLNKKYYHNNKKKILEKKKDNYENKINHVPITRGEMTDRRIKELSSTVLDILDKKTEIAKENEIINKELANNPDLQEYTQNLIEQFKISNLKAGRKSSKISNANKPKNNSYEKAISAYKEACKRLGTDYIEARYLRKTFTCKKPLRAVLVNLLAQIKDIKDDYDSCPF